MTDTTKYDTILIWAAELGLVLNPEMSVRVRIYSNAFLSRFSISVRIALRMRALISSMIPLRLIKNDDELWSSNP